MPLLLLTGRDSSLLERAHRRLQAANKWKIKVMDSQESLRIELAELHPESLLLVQADELEPVLRLTNKFSPNLPCIVYEDRSTFLSTREATRLGALDVISLKQDSPDSLNQTISLALTRAAKRSQKEQTQPSQTEEAVNAHLRGQLLLKRLASGDSSLFFLNANRSEFLMVQVVPRNDPETFCPPLIEAEWRSLFGSHSSMVLPTSAHPPRLLLGASIEMSYADKRKAQRTLQEYLERFFGFLESHGCVAVSAACGADLLNAHVFRHMFALCDLAFYADKCSHYPYDHAIGTAVLPESCYLQFCSHIMEEITESAIDCIHSLAQLIMETKPAPDFAREGMLRFLWLYATLRHRNLMPCVVQIQTNHLEHMTRSLCELIRSTERDCEAPALRGSPMDQLVQAIERNPGRNLSLEQAANLVGFSRSHFCLLFKQHTGRSYAAFVIDQRMKRAADLLKHTRLPITQIGSLVGIRNTYYFRKLFERHHGCSTDDFRRLQQPEPDHLT